MWIINNWHSLQSYKDRKPPWIRLHKTLLDNFEFHSMSKNAKSLLPMFWLLASEHDDPKSGIIKYNLDQISFRLRVPKGEVLSAITECIDGDFIQEYQQCSSSVTNPLQKGNKTVPPETETEAEKRQTFDHEKEFESLWEQYPRKEGKKEAFRHFKATVKDDDTMQDILIALANYKALVAGRDRNFIKQGSSWFNNWEDYHNYDHILESDTQDEYNFVEE